MCACYLVGTELLSGNLGSPQIGISLRAKPKADELQSKFYGNLTNNWLLLFIETESTGKNCIYEKLFQLQNEKESVSCVKKLAVI